MKLAWKEKVQLGEIGREGTVPLEIELQLLVRLYFDRRPGVAFLSLRVQAEWKNEPIRDPEVEKIVGHLSDVMSFQRVAGGPSRASAIRWALPIVDSTRAALLAKLEQFDRDGFSDDLGYWRVENVDRCDMVAFDVAEEIRGAS